MDTQAKDDDRSGLAQFAAQSLADYPPRGELGPASVILDRSQSCTRYLGFPKTEVPCRAGQRQIPRLSPKFCQCVGPPGAFVPEGIGEPFGDILDKRARMVSRVIVGSEPK
ncbi:hypothetical protein GCM10027396_18810 [Insolitispirillum peregrinum]